ncbi:MAG: hypothetical protein RIQ52_22 [Pseudomonadota bacterium]|jgi:zinc protease
MSVRHLWRVLLVSGLSLVSWSALALPQIQHWTSQRGAEIYFAPIDGLPLLDVRVMLDAGTARDGDRPGIASLTAAMLDAGAGSMDADAIARSMDSLGAQLVTGAGRDYTSISLRALTRQDILTPALETAALVLAKPVFADADFQRERQNVLLSLQQREESPGDIAGMRFFEQVYGSHPYAHPKEGYADSVSALTPEDLRRFHQRYFVARNATVVMVGAIERQQAEQIAEQLVAALPEGQKPEPLPGVAAGTAGADVREPFPSEQTHIFVGMPGLKVGDPDYFPLYVGNHILGGSGLVSRISHEVREKRGLSYSAYSYFYPLKVEGPFMMGLQTRNDQAEQALSVLRDTLAAFIADGPGADELKASKSNITGGFVLRLDSNRKWLEQVSQIAFYQLPLNYLDVFTQKVEAVTLEQIKDAWKRRINPQSMRTVLVGGGARGANGVTGSNAR